MSKLYHSLTWMKRPPRRTDRFPPSPLGRLAESWRAPVHLAGARRDGVRRQVQRVAPTQRPSTVLLDVSVTFTRALPPPWPGW